MVRARGHKAATRKARRDAEALMAAWREYDRTLAALAGIVQCSSTDEETGAPCQLVVDEDGTHPGKHRHRVMGTQAVVTW